MEDAEAQDGLPIQVQIEVAIRFKVSLEFLRSKRIFGFGEEQRT
jgi:hypothetical protein